MDQIITLRCVIADDEPLAIKVIEKHIAEVPRLRLIKTCKNAFEVADLLNTTKVDLLFLDIEMPGLSGLQLLKTMAARPAVILTTAYSKYAVDGFDLGVTDYLLKPITFERFLKAVNRLSGTDQPAINTDPASHDDEFIFLKADKHFHKTRLADILYLEAAGNFIKFHLIDQRLVVAGKIGEYSERLAKKGFIRIHKSFIISAKHILRFGGNTVLVAGTELPVGDAYRSGLLAWSRFQR